MSEHRSPAALVAELLGSLANASLRLDPQSKSRLGELEGRSMRLEIERPGVLQRSRESASDSASDSASETNVPDSSANTESLTLTVRSSAIELTHGQQNNPNVIVRGSVGAFMQWFGGNPLRGVESPPRPSLQIDGDETVLEEITSVFRQFRPAPPEPLDEWLKGAPRLAENVLSLAEAASAALRSAAAGIVATAKDGASARFTDQQQLHGMLARLDELKLNVDRLEARIQAEENRRPSRGSPPGHSP